MPVDLRALPEKLALPQPPCHGRWCLVILLCSLLAGILLVLLWPDDSGRMSLWFWCCVVIFPLMLGLALFALRLRVYEEQREYRDSWNQHQDQQRAALIEQGQRPVDVLAVSYCSPAANNRLAEALRKGSTPLLATYVESQKLTMHLSQLTPQAKLFTADEYRQRLAGFFRQVMAGLDEELQHHARATPLRLRIRHNQILSDDEVLSLWRAAYAGQPLIDQVVFAAEEDGLLWLDSWLDSTDAFAMLLSLEINLFQAPVDGQAESVSALLFAQRTWCAKHAIEPMAAVHRPVSMTDVVQSLDDALRWGHLAGADDEVFFTWQSQLPGACSGSASIAMRAAGRALDRDRSHQLDASLGSPGCAVGHMGLIVACEQAQADSQPQLLMLQDVSPQCCVVRPFRSLRDKD